MDDKQGQKSNTLFALLIAITSGFSFGMAQSISSGIITEEPWDSYSDVQKGVLSASVLFGAAVGSFIAGSIADKLGRRMVLAGASCIQIIFSIAQVLQKNINVFVVLRSIMGIGSGALTSVGPVYVSEMASAKTRGATGSVYQLSLTLGITADYILNYVFHDVYEGWRYELGLVSVPALCGLIIACIMPESYDWQRKHPSAINHEGYVAVEDDPDTVQLLPSSSSASSPSSSSPFSGVTEFFASLASAPKSLALGMLLAVGNQWTGINAIMNFSPKILESIGLDSTKDKLFGTIFVGVWNSLAAVSPILLVDSFGRRPLLLCGFTIMTVGLLLCVLATSMEDSFGKHGIANLIGLALFLLGFEGGSGPLTPVLASELFPPRARANGVSVVSMTMWTLSIILVFAYLPLVSAITQKYTFLIFLLIGVTVEILVFFFIPETKGKSLDSLSAPTPVETYNPAPAID